MYDDEYHVASYVVSTQPGNEAGVAGRITATGAFEVHAAEQGKLVVTAEAGNVRELAELADKLAQIESVINVAPVYHEYEEAEAGVS